jgi:hypothetical protein
VLAAGPDGMKYSRSVFKSSTHYIISLERADDTLGIQVVAEARVPVQSDSLELELPGAHPGLNHERDSEYVLLVRKGELGGPLKVYRAWHLDVKRKRIDEVRDFHLDYYRATDGCTRWSWLK